MAVATLPWTSLDPNTSYTLLASSLFVRGIGLGATMMPAMAAAYAVLDSPQVPRATSALNVIQRVGGSMGTALLAVVLQRSLTREFGTGHGVISSQQVPPAVRAHLAPMMGNAFSTTFWWATGLAIAAIAPAAILARANRRTRAAARRQAAARVAA